MEGISFATPDMKIYNNRLATFDTWPHQLIPDKHQLSKAGFYYSGKGDIVQCFSCSTRLCQWGKDDDAVQQHMIANNACLYLNISTHIKDFDSTWRSPLSLF